MQVLARALGGAVGPNPDGNFVLTIEQVQPTQQLQQFSRLHSAVQQALAAEAARGGSSSVAAAEAAGSSSCRTTGQQPTTAAAAREDASLVSTDAGRVSDAIDSMSISSSSNSNSRNHDDSGGSDRDAGVTAAAAGTKAAVAAANGGCFRLIESHGDQVGIGCVM